MDKQSLFDIVTAYVANEEAHMGYAFTKSARNQWIIDSVKEELSFMNKEYQNINDTDAKRIFRDTIEGQFKTEYFRSFLKIMSKPSSPYYKKILKPCIVNSETIDDFLSQSRNTSSGTSDFFKAFCNHQNREYGVLQNNGNQTESTVLEIHGATIIDEEFINFVKSGKEFTMPEFYGAKQNNNCQWYGIINDFDVIRKGYNKLKETVLSSFIEEKDRKVSAIVHGTGGSGKSTVLRRLAIDCCKDSFDVIWLEKGKIEKFVEKGLSIMNDEIGKDNNRKFLIIIEDWYRMFDNENSILLGNKILDETFRMNNTRIVIGDRESNNSYKQFRNNSFELQLSSEDNKEIIEKIIEKYPDWKLISGQLFTENTNWKSSLFLLLFIVAHMRINQKELNASLGEPQQLFQNIIESDLKFIANEHIGLAKALHYWGCMYADFKITISYEAFLGIADFYNEKDTTEISDLFSRWDADDEILDKLKLYVYKNEKGFIQFNHDILAEIGLRKIIPENWKKFGTKIKLQLLDVVTEKGDDYSASVLLTKMLVFQEHLFTDSYDKLHYIKRLVIKNNRRIAYLSTIHSLIIDDQTLKEVARLVWDNKIDDGLFWNYYFLQISDDDIICNDFPDILSKAGLSKYHPYFIENVLKYAKNTDVGTNFTNTILQNSFSEHISFEVICFCLNYSSSEVQVNFSNKFLLHGNINDYVVTNRCLIYATHETKKKFIKRIQVNEIWKTFMDFKGVIKCLNSLDDRTKKLFFKRVLRDDDYEIIKKFFEQCRKFGNKEFCDMFIKIAADNKEGEHPNVVRDILFVEGIGLGGYLNS